MKMIISEVQYKRLMESESDQKVLHIPSLKFFGDDHMTAWGNLQDFLKQKGNPPYSIGGNIGLQSIFIESLGSLRSVGGYLSLRDCRIKSLGDLESVGGFLNAAFSTLPSLGNLKSVDGDLYIAYSSVRSLGALEFVRGDMNCNYTPVDSFGNLKFVGGDLFLKGTPLSKMYGLRQMRDMVDVVGAIDRLWNILSPRVSSLIYLFVVG